MPQTNSTMATPEEIIGRYCSRLPAEIRKIADMLEDGMQGARANQSLLETLHQEMHRMAGAAMCMGFPFLGQELSRIEEQLSEIEATPEAAETRVLYDITRKLESIARLSGYTTPQNSILLRNSETKTVNLRTSRSQLSDHFRSVMAEQRVLFADDDHAIRMLMRDILYTIGVAGVELAANGREMTEKLHRFSPTVIITDWYMAPINGIEFLRELRKGALPCRADLPVIFLSSKQTVGHVQSAIDEGVDHFLAKPFSVGLVEKSIYQLFTKKKMNRDVLKV